jgi:hypothetical protein
LPLLGFTLFRHLLLAAVAAAERRVRIVALLFTLAEAVVAAE